MKTILTTFLIFISFSIYSQIETCKVLLDKINGEYIGKCRNGLANGKGKAIGEDTYIGTFKNGLPHGKGKYLSKNGDAYKGSWKNGLKDGKGKMRFSKDGKSYDLNGYWKDGEYVGNVDPDLSFRITSAFGLADYSIKEMQKLHDNDAVVLISIKSSFTSYEPDDLKIDVSSGEIIRKGKERILSNYNYPLHCEISYSVMTSGGLKKYMFIFDILKDGKYKVNLINN